MSDTSGDARQTRGGIRKNAWVMAMTGALAAVCFGADVGDTLYVDRVSVPIRNGKYAFDKVLARAVQGEQLTVTAVDGDFYKVKYTPPAERGPQVEGFVMQTALSAREVAAATTAPVGQGVALAGAGASKGVIDAAVYAQSKGLSADPFYKMVLDSHGSVTNEAFESFTLEGRVGPHKPNPGATPVPTVQ